MVWAADNPQAILESYNALYLHEEVQMEGLVRNIGGFTRFLQAMSFSQAAVLNLANESREVQVSRKTVEGYLEVMEDLLLGFRLEVFAKRAQRELATHPKFYFFDPEAKRFMLYRGDDRFSRDGVLCMPVEKFLLELRPDHFPS